MFVVTNDKKDLLERLDLGDVLGIQELKICMYVACLPLNVEKCLCRKVGCKVTTMLSS